MATVYLVSAQQAQPDLVTNVRSDDVPDYYETNRPHPGHNLTPATIRRIYAEAEQGRPEQQCDLFEDCIEQDAHVRSQFDSRRDAVAGKEWIIQAGGEKPEDHRAAELLEEALKSTCDLRETIEHQLTDVPMGWGPTEVLWGLAPNGVFSPIRFVNVPHWRFAFDKRGQPRLRATEDMTNGIELEPRGWWFSRRPHRLTVKAGLMRTAVWWSLFKRMDVGLWVSFLERFGLPLTLGKYPESATKEEKAVLRQAVEMLGRGAIFSDGMTIEFAKADTSASSDVHGPLVDLCNAELSKLITGATLTSGEGSSAGSYALGRVHQNVSFDRVVSDALRLGYSFAQQIGRPFLEFNGLVGAPPRLRVNVVPEMDALQRMEIYKGTKNDLDIDVDDDQVRTDFQIKPPRASLAAEIARRVLADVA